MAHLLPGSQLEGLLAEAVRDHNVIPLTGYCNLSCLFCSHRQNPPGIEAFSFPALSEELLQGLMPYLDPEKKIIVGESATRLREGEPLTHPQFIGLIQKLRLLHPVTPLQITTNGTLLDEHTASLLASLKPLEVILSLNSASDHGRKMLMGDNEPKKALNAVQWFQKYRIPFHGSLVSLPHLVGWDDLKKTIEYLDQSGALTVRILLPGYTKYSDPILAPPPGDYQKCLSMLDTLRQSLKTPLLAEPPLIESLDAHVEGVIRGSPAEEAGILPGDQIISVAGGTVFSRVDAYERLFAEKNPLLELLRSGKRIELLLNKISNQSSGLAFAYDLAPAQADRVRASLPVNMKALMLVSNPALKRWLAAVEKINLRGLTIRGVSSASFGGSIACAGLLTVHDFQLFIDQLADLHRFEKILLPAVAFDSSGRDLFAKSYLNIRTGSISLQLVG